MTTPPTPKTSRTDPRLELFVDAFNIVYPDWTIAGDSDRSLRPRHVDFDTNLRKYWGRCGPGVGGRIYYRVNAGWWAEHDRNEQMGLLIHELAHVKECPGHPPEFWEQVVKNYHRLENEEEKINRLIEEPIEWDAVAEWLVHDPTSETVDNRSEVAYERRVKLAEELDYGGTIEPFSGMKLFTMSAHGSTAVSVPVENLEYEEKTIEQLIDFFRARPRPGLHKENNAWVIDPPVVEGVGGDRYRVVEGDRRAALAVEAVVKPSDTRETLDVRLATDR